MIALIALRLNGCIVVLKSETKCIVPGFGPRSPQNRICCFFLS